MKEKTRIRFLFPRSVALWLLAGVLFLAGCAGFGKRLETPRIQIAHIQVQGARTLETVLLIDLRVFNTNDIPITIKGIDCELDVNDQHLASGVSSKETTIPSYETETIPVTVYSSAIDLFKGFLRLPQREKITYRIKGKVRIDAGSLAPSTVPFSSEGEWTFGSLGDSRQRPLP